MEGGRGAYGVSQQNSDIGQAYFAPIPSPSPILNPSTSPLKTLFDSSQLSGSINVQDDVTTSFLDPAPKYACFAGYASLKWEFFFWDTTVTSTLQLTASL